jgi:hypothetical protein
MVMNEYRLNPDPTQKNHEEQMEVFGEGAKLPEGYVPKEAKVKAQVFSLSRRQHFKKTWRQIDGAAAIP